MGKLSLEISPPPEGVPMGAVTREICLKTRYLKSALKRLAPSRNAIYFPYHILFKIKWYRNIQIEPVQHHDEFQPDELT